MTRIRAVLHAHSTWSYDGQWSLGNIARLYGCFGVNAVMMSEHDSGFEPTRFAEYRAACAAASTRSCTLVPGIEYSSPDNDIHILTWGLDTFLTEHRPVSETLRAVHNRGGGAILAHPIRQDAWRKFDSDWVPFLSGIELWNRKSNGVTWCPKAWNLIRTTGLPATVGQDFHRLRQLYPLTMRFDLTDGMNMETAFVESLINRNLTPQAFRRPVLSKDKTPKSSPHFHLERLRRSAVSLLKRR